MISNEVQMLASLFRENPYAYFTENDIVSELVHLVRSKHNVFLKCLDDKVHSNIHTEYSTPFRCDMSNNKFRHKPDSERTPKGGLYTRGKYDLVILNKDFVKNNITLVLQGQNYGLLTEHIQNISYPIIDLAVEVMFSRSPLKYSRGKDKEKEISNFKDKIFQDYDKLLFSKEKGFVSEILMVVFIRDTPAEILQKVCSISNSSNAILVIPERNV